MTSYPMISIILTVDLSQLMREDVKTSEFKNFDLYQMKMNNKN